MLLRAFAVGGKLRHRAFSRLRAAMTRVQHNGTNIYLSDVRAPQQLEVSKALIDFALQDADRHLVLDYPGRSLDGVFSAVQGLVSRASQTGAAPYQAVVAYSSPHRLPQWVGSWQDLQPQGGALPKIAILASRDDLCGRPAADCRQSCLAPAVAAIQAGFSQMPEARVYSLDQLREYGAASEVCLYQAGKVAKDRADVVFMRLRALLHPASRSRFSRVGLHGRLVVIPEASKLEQDCREAMTVCLLCTELDNTHLQAHVNAAPGDLAVFLRELKDCMQRLHSIVSVPWDMQAVAGARIIDTPLEKLRGVGVSKAMVDKLYADLKHHDARRAAYPPALHPVLEVLEAIYHFQQSKGYDYRLVLRQSRGLHEQRTFSFECLSSSLAMAGLSATGCRVVACPGTCMPTAHSAASHISHIFDHIGCGPNRRVAYDVHDPAQQLLGLASTMPPVRGQAVGNRRGDLAEPTFLESVALSLQAILAGVPPGEGILVFLPLKAQLTMLRKALTLPPDPALLAVRQAWIGLPHLEVELVDDTATQASAHAMLVRYKDYVDNHGTAIAVMSAHGRSVHALSLRGKHARAVLCPGLSYINYQESLPLRVWWEDLSRSGGGQAWYHRQAVSALSLAASTVATSSDSWGVLLVLEEDLYNRHRRNSLTSLLPAWLSRLLGTSLDAPQPLDRIQGYVADFVRQHAPVAGAALGPVPAAASPSMAAAGPAAGPAPHLAGAAGAAAGPDVVAGGTAGSPPGASHAGSCGRHSDPPEQPGAKRARTDTEVEPGPSDQDRELDTQEGIAARALNTLFDQCIAGAKALEAEQRSRET